MKILTLLNKIVKIMDKKLKEKNTLSEAMAVPKKRRSKSKGKTRLSNWKNKAVKLAQKAISIAKGKSKEEKAEKDEKEVVDIKNIDSKTLDDKIED